MIQITEFLKTKVSQALRALDLPECTLKLEHPTELTFGDYSSNVAMILAKQVGKNPLELAELIATEISKNLGEDLEKVEAVKPGFINFHLSQSFFAKSTKEINEHGENFGKSDIFAGKKVMVEFTDPNPFKEFHIGHLMSNAIGESFARIIQFSGAKVLRANWQGDVGPHVAKALWGKMQKPDLSWGEAYTYGSAEYENHKEEIDLINKKVYEKSDPAINTLYDEGRAQSLEHFEKLYDILGTKFDYYFFEGTEGIRGIQIVKNAIGSVFEESDGAVVFKGEKYDLHTRVFLNNKGLPTYEAKELGLNSAKFEKEPELALSIIITANEQSEYFKVLLKVMELLLPAIGAKTVHKSHGMMRFAEGKMSSRKGNVITGESLINDTKTLALAKIADRDFSEENKKTIAEIVAVGAIKYTILRGSPGKDIIYDPEKSISFEGDSGPYLQYSYTRARSVLEKAKTEGINPSTTKHEATIYELERVLYRFPEVVALAYHELAPNHIATYLIELAAAFNSFYAQNKIIDPDNQESGYRLTLTENFSTVMKNGLYLLGIKTLERM